MEGTVARIEADSVLYIYDLTRGGQWRIPADQIDFLEVNQAGGWSFLELFKSARSEQTAAAELSLWQAIWYQNQLKKSKTVTRAGSVKRLRVHAKTASYEEVVARTEWNTQERTELYESTREVLRNVGVSSGWWHDPYIIDYLWQALIEVHPSQFPKGRPGSLRVKVLRSSLANAFALDDGTVIFTTGMLSHIRNRDELLAVTAHEVAHIALEHNLQNFQQSKRKKELSTLLGIIGAGIVAYAGSKSEALTPDALAGLAIGAGIATAYLTKEVFTHIGAKYSKEQEYEADRLAQIWMTTHEKDQFALGRVLAQLPAEYDASRETKAQHSLKSHPPINERLAALGSAAPASSVYDVPFPVASEYASILSECRFANAVALIREGDYHAAADDLDEVLESGWTGSAAYLYKAIALRHTTSDADDNKRILALLAQAQQFPYPDPWVYGEEGLVHLRQNDQANAILSFQKLHDLLIDPQNEPDKGTLDWTESMIEKLESRGATKRTERAINTGE